VSNFYKGIVVKRFIRLIDGIIVEIVAKSSVGNALPFDRYLNDSPPYLCSEIIL